MGSTFPNRPGLGSSGAGSEAGDMANDDEDEA